MTPEHLRELSAKYPLKVLANGNIRTSPVRLAYTRGLFVPRAVKDGDPKKYGVTLLFAVGADLSICFNMANKAAVEKFGSNPPKLKNPFLRQDDVPDPGFQDGGIYLRCNATEENPPQVVDLQGRRLLSEADCYSGCWAIATIRSFAYDAKLNKGVAFGIQNILKIADDDKFSGRASADEDFRDLIDAAPGDTGNAVDAHQGPGQFFR